jgi:hypothetical protein
MEHCQASAHVLLGCASEGGRCGERRTFVSKGRELAVAPLDSITMSNPDVYYLVYNAMGSVYQGYFSSALLAGEEGRVSHSGSTRVLELDHLAA